VHVRIVHPDKQGDKRANKGDDKGAGKYHKDNLIFKKLYDVKHTYALRHIVNFALRHTSKTYYYLCQWLI
jgi:hypothetical protein